MPTDPFMRCPGWGSNPHALRFKLSRSAGWRTWASLAAGPSGIEPDWREIWRLPGVPSTTALYSSTGPARLAGPTSVRQSAPGESNPVSRAPRARGLPSSSNADLTSPVRGGGVEPPSPGSEPGRLPISRSPSLWVGHVAAPRGSGRRIRTFTKAASKAAGLPVSRSPRVPCGS